MFRFKVRSARSWLAASYGKVLAAELADRLVRRCAGQQGLFVTLTYRREEWEGAAELYHAAQAERHVRRFMERLGAYLGESLAGRWLCKLEFQAGGWVHWHLIVLGVKFVPHGDLERLWGHGFVWVRRMEEDNIRYVCKYVAKGGELPAFLYLERVRSVKVVRVSPGFWGEKAEPAVRPKRDDMVRWPVYVPIGEALESGEERTVVNGGAGLWLDFKMTTYVFYLMIRDMGARIVGGERGWLHAEGVRWSHLEIARAASSSGLCGRAGPSRGATASAGGPGRAPRGGGVVGVPAEGRLHSIQGGNPPEPVGGRRWLARVFEWQARCRDEVEAVMSGDFGGDEKSGALALA